MAGNRARAINVFLALDALRGEFVGPGKQDDRRKPYGEDGKYKSRRPLGQAQHRTQCIDDLQRQPGEDNVSKPDAVDVAALEFSE